MKQLTFFLFLTATLVPALAGRGEEHPRLVSVASARCTECHDTLLKNLPAVHPPAEDDCTLCHEMAVTEAGTEVTLTEQDPALCLICHDELTPAAEAELESAHAPVVDSCLNCHDPHASEHQGLLADSMPQVCFTCHDLADLGEPHGGQLTSSADCRRCHRPHGSENEHMLLAENLHAPFADGSCKGCHRSPFGDRVRLARRGEKLCLACHGDLLEGEHAVSVHPALEGEHGRAGCLSCHDPHMSDHGKLLVEAGPELCRQCHGDVVAAARAETGHYPAADDCLTCHLPHDSAQVRLLVEPREVLCATCHDTEDADLVATHLGADLGSLDCVYCHTPHGSDNPTLLARTLHYPILDGCDTCHEGAFNQLMDDGESSLCLMCHDDIGEIARTAEVQHAVMELGRCADCHNPHASAQDHLVKAPGAGPCADCHDDMVPGPGEQTHGVIDLLGCRACHEPHGGSQPKLLRRQAPELCLSCHGPRAGAAMEEQATVKLLDHFEVAAPKVSGMARLSLSADGQRDHPVSGHRVLGTPTKEEMKRVRTSFEGELTCLSCHDPHKGKAKLLLWDAASPMEACLHCHPVG